MKKGILFVFMVSIVWGNSCYNLAKKNDIIISDKDQYKDFFIAVGRDNSIHIKKQIVDGYKSVALFSTDGTKSCQQVSFEIPPLDRVVVKNTKSAIAIGTICGDGGYVSVTNDNGKTWKIVYHDGFLNDIDKTDKGFVAVGFNIMTSIDGIKWKNSLNLEEGILNRVKYIHKNLTIAVGNNLILVSRDGLKSWEKVNPKNITLPYLDGIYTKENKIYITSTHPKNFKIVSKDNAKSWSQVGKIVQ